MSACIFLFPNLILSAEQARALGKEAVPESLARFLSDSDQLRHSTVFDNPALSGYATEQWLWMLLSRRETLAPYAPYVWKGLSGPRVHQEFWALNGFRFAGDTGDTLAPSSQSFDIDDECDLRDLLAPLARRFGFDIQVLDGRFFFVRKHPWQVLCAPWLAQQNKTKTPAEGPDAPQWEALYREIISGIAADGLSARRVAQGKPPLDGLWVSGGGFEEQLLPYTQIRCVLDRDPFTRGVAEAAGISRNFILKSSQRWPDCAEGDRLCVFRDFEDETIKTDPQRWKATWDRVAQRMQTLLETAQGFEKSVPRLVATDGRSVRILDSGSENRSLLKFWKKSHALGKDWLVSENGSTS